MAFGVCANCGDVGPTEAAHIIPQVLGGVGTVELCHPCHGLQHGVRRQDIGALTRIGMERARAAGRHIGRPSRIPPEVEERIAELRDSGLSYSAIARLLEAEGVPRPTNKSSKWHHTHIVAAVRRVRVRRAASTS